jgi:SAM-dependent methyltransferase
MAEWFADETFWEEMYPHMFSEERLKTSETEVEKIFELLNFQGGHVLDLCCGPGRHTVVMAKKGCTVTAVDKTPFLLKRGMQKASEEGVEAEWVEEDMRYFVRPETYDLVLNMLTSLGYFDDKQEDILVLENIYQNLKPGGMCAFDMMGKEVLARNFYPTVSDKLSNGNILIQRLKVFDEWSRLHNERILVRPNGQATSFTFNQTIYSGQEIKERLLQVGFKKVKLYGNVHGDEYGPDAKRLVVLAWKP